MVETWLNSLDVAAGNCISELRADGGSGMRYMVGKLETPPRPSSE